MRDINLIGQRFDKLLVIEFFSKSLHGNLWVCKCDCGNEIIKGISQLRAPKRKFGGCKKCEFESRSKAKKTHGFSKTRLYKTWKGMRARCSNPKEMGYKYYGARGIKVCEEWQKSFVPFKSWALSHGYTDDLTIERKNNDGNYCPENCEWITRSENIGRKNTYNANKNRLAKVI